MIEPRHFLARIAAVAFAIVLLGGIAYGSTRHLTKSLSAFCEDPPRPAPVSCEQALERAARLVPLVGPQPVGTVTAAYQDEVREGRGPANGRGWVVTFREAVVRAAPGPAGCRLIQLAIVTVDDQGNALVWPDEHASSQPFLRPTPCPASDVVTFPPFSG